MYMKKLIEKREKLRNSLIGCYDHDLPIRKELHELTKLIEKRNEL